MIVYSESRSLMVIYPRLEPLVPSIHGPSLVKAFTTKGEDPIFYPSGVPYGKFSSLSTIQPLKYYLQKRKRKFISGLNHKGGEAICCCSL